MSPESLEECYEEFRIVRRHIGLLALLLGLAICGFLFDYNLSTYFGKDIPWYGDCLAGLFTAPVNVVAAVVGYVLVECDTATPIFGDRAGGEIGKRTRLIPVRWRGRLATTCYCRFESYLAHFNQ